MLKFTPTPIPSLVTTSELRCENLFILCLCLQHDLERFRVVGLVKLFKMAPTNIVKNVYLKTHRIPRTNATTIL